MESATSHQCHLWSATLGLDKTNPSPMIAEDHSPDEPLRCLLAAAACCLLRSLAFVPAPATRSDALTTATGAAVIATIPAGADAFVYKGTFSCM